MELEAKKFGVRAVVSKAADPKVLLEMVESLLVPNSAGPQPRETGAESQAMPVSFATSEETGNEAHSKAAADPPIDAD